MEEKRDYRDALVCTSCGKSFQEHIIQLVDADGTVSAKLCVDCGIAWENSIKKS